MQANGTLGAEGKSAGFPVALAWVLLRNNADYYSRIERCPTAFKEQVLRDAHPCPSTVMCCHLGKKRSRKAGEKSLSKSSGKGEPQGSPQSHSWWHLRPLEGSVSHRDDASVQALPQTLAQKSSKK